MSKCTFIRVTFTFPCKRYYLHSLCPLIRRLSHNPFESMFLIETITQTCSKLRGNSNSILALSDWSKFIECDQWERDLIVYIIYMQQTLHSVGVWPEWKRLLSEFHKNHNVGWFLGLTYPNLWLNEFRFDPMIIYYCIDKLKHGRKKAVTWIEADSTAPNLASHHEWSNHFRHLPDCTWILMGFF